MLKAIAYCLYMWMYTKHIGIGFYLPEKPATFCPYLKPEPEFPTPYEAAKLLTINFHKTIKSVAQRAPLLSFNLVSS